MSDKLSLSFVFPAYNEEKNIGKTIDQAVKVGRDLQADFEVVAVNDGSADNTKKVIEDKVIQYGSSVRLLDRQKGSGKTYGKAVWSGLMAASKEWVFFSDSDLQFDLKEVEKLLEHIGNYDVVIGYRAPRRDPFFRIANAKLWNLLVRILFGLKVKDIDCAFKLFRRSQLKKVEISSGGATFSAELLIRLKKAGLIFKEVPVTHLPNNKVVTTGANPKVIIKAFRELINLHKTTDLGRFRFVKDMVKFGIVGAVSTVLDFGGLNIAHLALKMSIPWATFVGFMIGTINSYLMNNYYTYSHHQKKANWNSFVKLAIVGGIGLGLTELIMYILTLKLGMYYNYSKLIAVVIVFFWNFIGSRKFVFHGK